MIYYRINNNKQILEATRTQQEEADWKKCEDSEFNVSRGFDLQMYFDSYIATEEYKVLKKAYDEEQNLKDLRERREEECFPYINRGELWYKTLTENQITELNAWYEAWLKVTETKKVPDAPVWLKK